MYEAQGQGVVFLVMVYTGVAIGVWDGWMRVVVNAFAKRRAVRIVMEALTALGAGLLFFAGLMRANYGVVRVYTVLGALCGALLFRCTVEKALVALARRTESACVKYFLKKRRKTGNHVE